MAIIAASGLAGCQWLLDVHGEAAPTSAADGGQPVDASEPDGLAVDASSDGQALPSGWVRDGKCVVLHDDFDEAALGAWWRVRVASLRPDGGAVLVTAQRDLVGGLFAAVPIAATNFVLDVDLSIERAPSLTLGEGLTVAWTTDGKSVKGLGGSAEALGFCAKDLSAGIDGHGVAFDLVKSTVSLRIGPKCETVASSPATFGAHTHVTLTLQADGAIVGLAGSNGIQFADVPAALIGEVGITASTGLDVGTLGLEHLTLKACP